MSIRKVFFEAVNRMLDDSYRAATVGKHNPDTTVTYTVTGRADYLWITFPDQTTAVARNDAGVPQTEDLQVWVRKEYGPKGGPAPWVIEGRSAAGGLSVPSSTPADGVLPHTVGSHSDVTITAAASGDVLAHNGTAWVDEAPITTSAGAGDAGKLVRLDGDGMIDASMVDGGVTDFTGLGDVPSSYTGEAGKALVVNAGENGSEWQAIPREFTPASASAPGVKGDFTYDADYFYICINTDEWQRVVHATW